MSMAVSVRLSYWVVRMILAFQRRLYAPIFRWLGNEAGADLLKRELKIKTPLLASCSGNQAPVEVLADALRDALGHEEQFLVPRLRPRSMPPLNRWTYQNERIHFDIEPGDKVLDIGSGGWPFKQATHLADMHLGETSHRTEPLRQDGRPFLVIDISRMPFRDKEWDFTFCSHVLEHLDRPGDACRELMRVSRKGYIEVPTRLSDVMLNFTKLHDHHRWHGLVLGQTLVLIEWQGSERKDVGTDHFFKALHSTYQNPFQEMFENNLSTYYGMLTWHDHFDFLIIDKQGQIVDQEGGRPA